MIYILLNWLYKKRNTLENNIIPENVSIEEVLRSHDFELDKQENGDWLITPEQKGFSYFFDQIFLYAFILGLLIIMFSWGAELNKLLFGVVFLVGGLLAFFKNRSALSGKSIRISEKEISIEKEHGIEIVKAEIIKGIGAKIEENKLAKICGTIFLIKENGQEVELFQLNSEEKEFLEKDIMIILKYLEDGFFLKNLNVYL